MWIAAAVLSAVFAGITSILAKCGIKKTDSDVATALRTGVVLVFSWIAVLISGSAETVFDVEARSFLFLFLSGLATGASWICYFKALSRGDVNKVTAVDKSSTMLSVLFAVMILGERENLAVRLICTLILGVGIFLMAYKKNSGNKVSGENGKAEVYGTDCAAEHADVDGVTESSATDDGAKAPAAECKVKSSAKNAMAKAPAKNGWALYAGLSAVFAAITSVLAKIGITGVESNLGTALRTCVVLVMAWAIVLAKGKGRLLKSQDKKELVYISLSGIATGASWLCYYYAIQNGVVSAVVPIDKMSILVTVVFSYFVFGEKLNRRAFVGLVLMLAATVGMALLS